MLTKVEVRTTSGMLLTLPLEDVSDGYIVADIQGLDPVKATLVSSSSAQMDGEQFQSSRRDSRNIVMKVALEPDYVFKSVRDLRTNLYSFLMPKSQVSLRFFMLDGLTVDISGRVESFESTLFSQEPEVDISIMCFRPDFIELEPTLIEDETVSTSLEFDVDYEGTVEAGFKFVLNVDRDLTELTIYLRTPDNVVQSLDFAAALIAGDVLTINTITGSKAVTLLRAGTLSSLLYAKSPQSPWLELVKGENKLRVYTEGDPIPFTIEYTTRHGGL